MKTRQIKDFEAYTIYEDGRLFSRHTRKFLKPFKTGARENNCWYAYKLCKEGLEKTFKVHRLVAMYFIPNPEELETVNHKDGDTSNNHVCNLEWLSRGDNKRHAFEEGISTAWWQGSLTGTAKSTEVEIGKACKFFDQGKYPTEVGRILDIPTARLDKVYSRTNWKCVSEEFNWWRK